MNIAGCKQDKGSTIEHFFLPHRYVSAFCLPQSQFPRKPTAYLTCLSSTEPVITHTRAHTHTFQLDPILCKSHSEAVFILIVNIFILIMKYIFLLSCANCADRLHLTYRYVLFFRRPIALAYVIVCPLPCFGILLASSKVGLQVIYFYFRSVRPVVDELQMLSESRVK